MSVETDRKRMSQSDNLKLLLRNIKLTEMVNVYLSDRDDSHDYLVYCALIPTDHIERSLSHTDWDFFIGSGMPGAVPGQESDSEATYLRIGNEEGIEPLVIVRNFHDIRENYNEICEEFRLFHNLYHDRKTNQYIKIDDIGNEHVVAKVEPKRIEIRIKEIRQYLAIKEMHLAIQFDLVERSSYTLEELGLTDGIAENRTCRDASCWMLDYGFYGIGIHQSFSRLLGKHLLTPLPKDKSGFWGFSEEEPKKYIEFIIGVNNDGDMIIHSSNPKLLANNFGANPGAPHYLTPVHFKKQVLDKYYQQPSKYSIKDTFLRCGYLWDIRLDNHHDDKVCALLGDLGRDLPYEEQLHWRSHNIPPTGGMSETFLQRQIHAQFTASDRPEHVFQSLYEKLSEACEQYLGFPILLPLDPDDMHHLQCVRSPSTDEQKDFDELILGLAKILIGSINNKQLERLILDDQKEELQGSISYLEAAFAACGITEVENHIVFLRRLQSLRSSGSAHLKGKKYRKIATKFGIDSQNLRSVFSGILLKANEFLNFLIAVVHSGKLSGSESTTPEGTH